jgi:excinuclease ABC subunit C
VVSEFIKQFYAEASHIPREVLLPNEVEEAVIIQQWLNQQRGGQKVQIRIPQRGTSRDLVKMATENALETLNALKSQWEADTHKQSQALAEIQEALGMENPPNRIECYDISNIHGTAAVGSMVVFEQGVPNKKLYRRFNIKSVSGPDDFASMEEMLARRFKRWQSSQEQHIVGEKLDESFAFLPNLLVVDGGKGQLSRAVKVVEQYDNADDMTIVGLAKEHELIFMPGRDQPVELPRNSQGLYLMQRVRDEAHRFAITAHRNMRKRERLVSRLDQIPGIGPSRKQELLKKFGSLEGVRKASPEELSEVSGVTSELAKTILQTLKSSKDSGEL